MPLLRQSLYAQNVNLYLAPTADGRDAWLGLMRTVGVEGRCFVVSSNMCVRRREGGGAGVANAVPGGGDVVGAGSRMDGVVQGTEHGRVHHPAGLTSADSIPEEEKEDDEDEAVTDKPSSPARGRRNSAFTEEGFEIALPRSAPTSPSQLKGGGRQRRRRKSIIDENGNEIVLCCDEDQPKPNAEMRPPSSPTKVSGQTRTATTSASAPAESNQASGTFLSRGGSCIVSPFGDVLAGPQWEDDEGLIYADVDFRDCIRGRLDLDAAGSYSRNDAFRLTVRGLDLEPLPY
jgi:nitrilase